MTIDLRTAGNARRTATIVANMANEGSSWADIYRITRIGFDIYAPLSLGPTQTEELVHLGSVRGVEDVIVTRRNSHTKWEVLVERTTFFQTRIRNQPSIQGDLKKLTKYRTQRAAETDASEIASLANEGTSWRKITDRLGVPLAVFAPHTLYENQTDDVVFVGTLVTGPEVLVTRDPNTKRWVVTIV